MNASRRSHDSMQTLGTAQAQLLKKWMDATWGLSGVRGTYPWTDQFGAWQRFFMEAMELQIEWSRRWMTSIQDVYGAVPGGRARQKVGAAAKRPTDRSGSGAVTGSPSAVGASPSRAPTEKTQDASSMSRVAYPDSTAEAQRARSWAEQGFPSSSGRDLLIQSVANASRTDAEHAARAVDAILDGIAAALVRGEEVRLPGFGSFKVIDTQARVGRNPRTNEPVVIPAGHKAVFRPALNLRKSVS